LTKRPFDQLTFYSTDLEELTPGGVDPLRSTTPQYNQGLGRPITSKVFLSKGRIRSLIINKYNFCGEKGGGAKKKEE
jgi:hypothetical protein